MEMTGEQLIPPRSRTLGRAQRPDDAQGLRAGLRVDRPDRRERVPGADGGARRPGERQVQGQADPLGHEAAGVLLDRLRGPGRRRRLRQGRRAGAPRARRRQTKLVYDVKASVGGKLAQIGSRLVDAAAKKVADDFFRNFNEKVGAAHGATRQVRGHRRRCTRRRSRQKDARRARQARCRATRTCPTVSKTTLMFFAAGSLVVFVVALSLVAEFTGIG